MDEEFDYTLDYNEDFMEMMGMDEPISYRDEYRNQTAFLNEGYDDYDDTEFAGYDDDAARGDEDAFTD